MRKATYTIKIKEDSNVEQIFEEIDNFMIDIEHKYTNVQISA